MARIEVGTYLRTYSLAEFKKALGVIYAEAGVKLKGYLIDAMLLRKGDKILPIGNKNLIPLPLENL